MKPLLRKCKRGFGHAMGAKEELHQRSRGFFLFVPGTLSSFHPVAMLTDADLERRGDKEVGNTPAQTRRWEGSSHPIFLL